MPANLGALCKRHHIMKTLGAWQLTQPKAGVFMWVSRFGHRYTVWPEVAEEPNLDLDLPETDAPDPDPG